MSIPAVSSDKREVFGLEMLAFHSTDPGETLKELV